MHSTTFFIFLIFNDLVILNIVFDIVATFTILSTASLISLGLILAAEFALSFLLSLQPENPNISTFKVTKNYNKLYNLTKF